MMAEAFGGETRDEQLCVRLQPNIFPVEITVSPCR